ncbi:MAG: hypothetical protein A3B74_00435 [Candidatus Kerfeldbacteria bacterium RIFCSPHIGHO2_02_FULL_42_14]|uniref:Glycosyltransferase 2-like domain-containing protein n=1 Tax=Candidatus Kerfeldbacteria bacterium RIFCSPHIGHO2_02_FULL_42_14 TaxID=1798540 RepID=A0A1G2AQW7_9BACT|nr:MAG: hypothetical protein A3B74_00435 [Candidatus Kerfeldbacteria bacterium RIFCSPHIGHO2_02_FULL_42_14]OGY81261.1 MAG: hypothetical protein A3E60_02305 [Candidatus Kerfeldbacteria bacterium RIFCSPHIGHO2_12_FULL_42_13]OGY83536.1 MAG: hypothetical protein A3I91_02740 [Candidatus Kerfeldbacteria bacterium RIFCSPLOWO2_02_FULL_42_19]OGY85779.1 MAG: hypothetical protein A3G01_03960 [Candidatus Kerfeldbacteria bacterium RIFCSPLOWO2_12_FULL_43_9]
MIFVIIAVYNRIEATLECLESLEKQTYRDFNITIIDDGSTDGSATMIRKRYPTIHILKGDGNLWWTGAMHWGVENVLQRTQKGDFILSLNNDVTFTPNYLEQLKKTSEKYGRAVTGSLCRDEAAPENILDRGVKIDWKHYSYSQTPFLKNQDDTTDIDTVSGRGVLIPIEVFQKIGNYRKKWLPHYGADYEFGFRAKKYGFPLALSYKAIVYLKDNLTGFRPKGNILSFAQAWKKLTHRKSPSNIFVQSTLVILHCPGKLQKLDTLYYVVTANIYIFLRTIVFYTLQKLHILKNVA